MPENNPLDGLVRATAVAAVVETLQRFPTIGIEAVRPYTLGEAALYLKCTPQYLKRMARIGRLTTHGHGRLQRVTRENLFQFLDSMPCLQRPKGAGRKKGGAS